MIAALSFPDVAGELALLLRATLLIAVAWAAAAALRRAGASAAARHMAWLLGIVALLALPILWWSVPAVSLPILPAEATTVAAAAASSSVAVPPSPVLAGPMAADVPAKAGWSVVLLLAYALGAAALLLRFVVGRRMLARLWSDAGAAPDSAWETLLSRLSSEVRLSRRVELRIARGPAVPMTWGTLTPKVLLPAEASEWPPERRRLVLLHELAHVARFDSLSRSLASLACALYWFHPGAWFAARQMRMEQEHAADDRVLIAGGSAQAYALSLLHLAKGIGAGPRLDQAAAMAGMYQLERRLVSITGPARRNRPGLFFLSSSALLAALATLIVAAGVPVSALPTLPGPLSAKGADMAFVTEEAADSAGSKGRPFGEARGKRGGSVERSGRDSPPVPQSRPGGGDSSRGDGSVRSEPASRAEAASRPTPPSPAYAEPLRDYDWELPRRDSRVRIEPQPDSSRPTRLALPIPLDAAPSERPGRPRWARNAPRLVQGNPPQRSPMSVQGPLMLTWSLDVSAQ